jgi:hypothetical protein
MTEIWIKPNGTEVPVNSENHNAARQLGWVPKAELEAKLEEDKPKRGRPPKVKE